VTDATLRLPFDQYQRYRLVSDVLAELRRGDERLTVLDVGGRTALLRQFLPGDQVHLVDVEASPEAGLVLGDGSRLPFATDAVDAVVTFDTLEHVPPAGREAFLRECRRVARRWVVVAGPYDTEGVAGAERMLEAFLQGKMGVEHRYLAEHMENGLPSLETTEAVLAEEGGRVKSVGHAGLHRWLALMCLELYMDRDPQLRALAARYYEFYNAALYASDHAPPVYRHAVVAVYDDAPLPSPEALFAPAAAPPGSFEPFRALAQELLDFDFEREVVSAEWQRLEGVNADLHLDIEGHRATLGVLQENNEEQQRVMAELEQRAIDLVGNEDLLLARIEELDGQVQAHEERAATLEEHAARLEAALQELRETLEAAQREMGELRADLEARTAEIASLDAHRAELEQVLDATHVTLGEKQRSLDLVRGELTNQRHQNELLQGALRDRWANLLRAIGVK